MNEKIIFFNVGWMDFYKGISNKDSISNGGKFVKTKGYGHEILNFQEYQESVYGYVQPKIDKKHGNPSTIKIEKIGALKTDEKVLNITVVWTAKKPNSHTCIIGWYLNATVYRNVQTAPKNSNRFYKDEIIGFYAKAKIENIKLLSRDERIFNVPRGKNGMGQSNVWYAENNPDFITSVKNYIFNNKNVFKGMPKQHDFLKRVEVEKSAIKIVSNHYRKLGYEIQSVEKDNMGWDLTAINGITKLRLEVKGLSGELLVSELTPNEFKNLKIHKDSYRLCVVTATLTKMPTLSVFAYSRDTDDWRTDNGIIIKFEEIVGAKFYT